MYKMYFLFFISASHNSPRIEIKNMNLYAESAEIEISHKNSNRE